MRDKLDNILSGGDCISEEMMLNYLEGTLTSSEQHRVEKHLLDCEFCCDALDGLSATAIQKVHADLNDLDQKIDSRINHSGGKIIQLKWMYRIAAVIALVALFGGGFYYLQSMKKSEKVFTENFEPYRDTSHLVSSDAATPQDERGIANGPEKTSTGAFKVEEKKTGEKTNVGKKYTGDPNVQTITVTSTPGSTSPQPPTQAATKPKDFSTTAPAAGNSADKSVAVNEIKEAKKPTSDESRDAEAFSKKVDDTKQLREEHYTVTQSMTTKEKKSVAQMPASANFKTTVATDSLSSASNVLIKEGIKQYDAKNYSAAIAVLQQVLKTEPDNAEALFYSGVSQLSLNEEVVAINLLESVIKNSPNKFSDAAKWYLSLAYLKKNKTSKAKKLLENLSHGNSEYKSNAQKTLDALK